MPTLFDETLDTPLAYDGQRQFDGGLNSFDQARILPPNQCTDFLNIDLEQAGIAKTRQGLVRAPYSGFTSYIRGLATYRSLTVAPQLVAFVGGELRYLSSWSSGFQTGASSVFSGGNISTASVSDKLYFIDGTSSGSLKYWNGSSVLEVPTTSASASIFNVVVNSGVVTISTLSPHGFVVGANIKISDLPSPFAQYNGYFTVTEVVNTTTLKYTSGTDTVASAGVNAGKVDHAYLCPLGLTHLIVSRGRLFAVRQSDPDALLVSDFLTPNFDTLTNSIRIGGDGSPITAIVEWTGDRIAVFKESRVFIVSGITQTTASQFQIETVENQNGALGQKAAIRIGADIAFVSRDGIRMLTRTLQGQEQAVSAPVSLPVDDLFSTIDISKPEEMCASYHENTAIFSAKTVSGGQITLAYDTSNKCWLGEWSGQFYPTCAVQATNGITLPSTVAQTALFTGLVIGDRTGRIYLWRKGHNFGGTKAQTYADDYTSANDSLTPYPTRIATRAFTFQEAGSNKLGNKLEVEFTESEAEVSIEIKMDNGSWVSIVSSLVTSARSLFLPFYLPQYLSGYPAVKASGSTIIDQPVFREVIVRVSSLSKYMAVRGVSISGFIQPYLVT